MKYIKSYESIDYTKEITYVENMRALRTEYLRKKKTTSFIKPDPREIEDIRNKFYDEKNKLRKLIENKFINEFSKHLELVKTEPDYLIFLLESDYGIKVEFEKTGLGNISVKIRTIFVDNRTKDKRFTNGGLLELYKAGQELSIEDLVSNYIIRLNKENEIRKRNKEKREFKKSLKKFNI